MKKVFGKPVLVGFTYSIGYYDKDGYNSLNQLVSISIEPDKSSLGYTGLTGSEFRNPTIFPLDKCSEVESMIDSFPGNRIAWTKDAVYRRYVV